MELQVRATQWARSQHAYQSLVRISPFKQGRLSSSLLTPHAVSHILGTRNTYTPLTLLSVCAFVSLSTASVAWSWRTWSWSRAASCTSP